MGAYEGFCNLFSQSKTLRNELIPIGRTLEYIQQRGILDEDIHRAESYKKVKKIIDRYHKAFIENALADIRLSNLDKYMDLYCMSNRDAKQEKELEKVQEDLRKQIVKTLTGHPQYKNLFKKEFIKEELQNFVKDQKEDLDVVKEFEEYTTYFTGFYDNRKNMYSDEAKSTAIAYRLIHQNLPKFIDNLRIFVEIRNSTMMDDVKFLVDKLKDKVGTEPIDEYFEIEGFNKLLTQKGIDIYNTILGAYTEEDNTKIKGLNEIINEYNQHEQIKKNKFPKMKPLFKQILSDRGTASFVFEKFDNDQEVCDAIKSYGELVMEEIVENEEQINLQKLLEQISTYQIEGIYIKNDNSISEISNNLYGDWSVISRAITRNYDIAAGKKCNNTQKYEEKRTKDLKGIKNYSIQALNDYLDEIGKEKKVESFFADNIGRYIEEMQEAWNVCKNVVMQHYTENKSLIKNNDYISKIKDFLDSIKKLQIMIKSLLAGREESDKDELFYGELLRVDDILQKCTPLYNKVRNYVTQKPYSIEKVKLNFNKSTLLDGWDVNKEKDNLGVFLLREGKYYLGIMDAKYNKVMEMAPAALSGDVYKKVIYKQISDPAKDMPHVVFSKKNLNTFQPNEHIMKIKNNGTYTKAAGDNFSIFDCHDYIDFLKDATKKYDSWKYFNFCFSDTKTYKDIAGFYREVAQQGYKIIMKDIDSEYIDQLVEDGKLYLFQIYNKDFSPYSKGKKNLHTMYFEMLFSEENLKDVVYKINGQAEIFYRKASINPEEAVVHAKNQPIPNRDPQDGKIQSTFEYDIIKNRRFTCDKFQLHLPITMNFKAKGELHFNLKVRNYIHDSSEMHVIGIDRGERNLLYLTVIDMEGNIKEQISLNQLISQGKNGEEHIRDYHKLLDEREKENKISRQSWTTINTIKELKEGYLSQVIHTIAELMLKYNAIVVLEDLNFGFMRSRQKFEKQVYQKFEKMLIDKLNYLVDKDRKANEPGGLLHAYQLADQFESFQKLGKQSGFLFYVPAWMTSKIDPTTGFVNLFYVKYDSIKESQNFVRKFENIHYNAEREWFEFKFDYSNFTSKAEGSREKWVVCSYGSRIRHFRNPGKNSEWDTEDVELTQAFYELLTAYKIDVKSANLIRQMEEVDSKEFWTKFLGLFNLMLQMRNSDEKRGIDQLISPVQNDRGEFFVSGKDSRMPLDADANGAYNIARKGLWIIEQIKSKDVKELDKVNLAIKNSEWLQYAQENIL